MARLVARDDERGARHVHAAAVRVSHGAPALHAGTWVDRDAAHAPLQQQLHHDLGRPRRGSTGRSRRRTQPLVTFTQRLFAFRAAHPALHGGTWIADSSFHDASGAIADLGATQTALAWWVGDVYVAYNRGTTAVTITLPSGPTWYRSGDTSSGLEPGNFAAPGDEYMMHQSQYGVAPRSLAVFIAR